MNKFIMPIIALAALSSASLADQKRSQDLRDIQPFESGTSKVFPKVVIKTTPLAVAGSGHLTSFQKLRIQQRNDTSGGGGVNN